MKVQHIIGADLSKATIDLCCHLSGAHLQIENQAKGFEQLLSWMGNQQINPCEVMVVLEHTGLYSYCFEHFLYEHHIAFSKVAALQVKHSIGLVRGKSDKLDAKRLAEYGFDKRQTLQPASPLSQQMERLQFLHTTRERLVKHKAALLNSVKEYRNIGLDEKDPVMRCQLTLIKGFEQQIEMLQGAMEVIVQANPCIQQNQDLLQSITGVGKVLSMATILKTKNFTCFKTARKFGCFCGIAPFPDDSGILKKKTRVSHLADKAMKTLLDLSAKCAIQHDPELREYYLRRIASGKSKMSTMNIVRNKIVYRMFAVIKRGTPFVENYLQTA